MGVFLIVMIISLRSKVESGVTRIILDNCKIISDGGDALSLWNTPDGMYYHNNCYFEGWVDYVCPRGYCFIENSQFLWA